MNPEKQSTPGPCFSLNKWFKHYSHAKKKVYYFNPFTKESLWEAPEGLVEIIDRVHDKKPNSTPCASDSGSSAKTPSSGPNDTSCKFQKEKTKCDASENEIESYVSENVVENCILTENANNSSPQNKTSPTVNPTQSLTISEINDSICGPIENMKSMWKKIISEGMPPENVKTTSILKRKQPSRSCVENRKAVTISEKKVKICSTGEVCETTVTLEGARKKLQNYVGEVKRSTFISDERVLPNNQTALVSENVISTNGQTRNTNSTSTFDKVNNIGNIDNDEDDDVDFKILEKYKQRKRACSAVKTNVDSTQNLKFNESSPDLHKSNAPKEKRATLGSTEKITTAVPTLLSSQQPVNVNTAPIQNKFNNNNHVDDDVDFEILKKYQQKKRSRCGLPVNQNLTKNDNEQFNMKLPEEIIPEGRAANLINTSSLNPNPINLPDICQSSLVPQLTNGTPNEGTSSYNGTIKIDSWTKKVWESPPPIIQQQQSPVESTQWNGREINNMRKKITTSLQKKSPVVHPPSDTGDQSALLRNPDLRRRSDIDLTNRPESNVNLKRRFSYDETQTYKRKISTENVACENSQDSENNHKIQLHNNDLRLKLRNIGAKKSQAEDIMMDWQSEEFSTEETPDWKRSDSKNWFESRRSNLTQSTPLRELEIRPKEVLIVCDTNILIKQADYVENLVRKRSLLGIPATVAIPYQTFRELDHIKTRESIGDKARVAIRLIAMNKKKNLILQDSNFHRIPAKPGVELTRNDDFILNYALQLKLQPCNKEKLLVILTEDTHLKVTAEHSDVPGYDTIEFTRWIKNYKQELIEKARQDKFKSQPSNTQSSDMDVDVDMDIFEHNFKVPSLPDALSQDDFKPRDMLVRDQVSEIPKDQRVQSCVKFYVDSLKEDFESYLKNVYMDYLQNIFEDLTRHSKVPTPSWNLFRYVMEIRSKWHNIIDRPLSPNDLGIIKDLITLIKKYNSGKEEFTEADVKLLFSLCQRMALEFRPKYRILTDNFLIRLTELEEEWNQNYINIISSSRPSSLSQEEDAQPALVALQHIHNCMKLDYEGWVEKLGTIENKSDPQIITCMRNFYNKITDFMSAIRNILDEDPNTLTFESESVISFQKAASIYECEDDSHVAFDIPREHILAFIQEPYCRKGAEDIIRQTTSLLFYISPLLEELCNGPDL